MRHLRGPTQSHSVQLPIEIWERVIDFLAEDIHGISSGTDDALNRFATVCRAWEPRCRFHLYRNVRMHDKGQVSGIAKMIRKHRYLQNAIHLVHFDRMDAMGLFATMMVRKLPSLQMIGIRGPTEWKSGLMHADVPMFLATFTSITRLSLKWVTFPSVVVFGRLVCALPNLTYLQCQWLTFRADGRATPPKHNAITEVHLSGLGSDTIPFLLTTSISHGLKRLTLEDIQDEDMRFDRIQQLLEGVGESLLSVHLHPDPYAKFLTGSKIHLGHNPHLEVFEFTSRFPTEDPDSLHHLLSGISPSKLREVSITVIVELVDFSRDVTLAQVLSVFRDDVYVKVDQLLSHSRFTKFRAITFTLMLEARLHVDVPSLIPSEHDWWQCISLRFPHLCAQERLRTQIVTEDRWVQGGSGYYKPIV
ncbi:uncharacterized protein FIBRA_08335 [Fibroporia radiculosa]|uniref:F-box domain-containing protein n=1 Tax=Fibroporia radiculosa TaxID=599839 RepID=J4GH50_9APHY|nr:uncharacterized protein FIBRA_08335 [Fibroporia radiculosa]CCM06088.1 predicted protein [Fibroporia radiculosa]